MSDSNSMKDINTGKIKQYMKEQGEASKSEIARETKLSFPTVTRILEALCLTGEIQESGHSNQTGGRSASIYTINDRFSLYLLIRIESGYITWSIKGLRQNTVAQNKCRCQSGLLQELDRLINDLQKKYANIKSIVIGIGAMILEGSVKETFFYKDLQGINIPLHFQNITDIPVLVENDMNIVVMGQWHKSITRPPSSVVIYYTSGCLGAGILINGEVWHGATNFAGELSFLPISNASLLNNDDVNQECLFDLYVKIIQIYSVVINPNQIILYQNDYINSQIDEIRKQCWNLLPHNALPHIELSNAFETDYENGLFALAQKLG